MPSIGVSQYSRAARMLSPGRAKDGSSHPNNKASHSAESSDGSFDSVFLIKNLDKWMNSRSLLDSHGS